MGCAGSRPREADQAAPPQAASKSASRKSFFSNKPSAPVGDPSIVPARRITFGVVMPESTGTPASFMFFDKEKPVEKVIAAAAAHAGFKVDRGKLVGSPEKLNLFTLTGDVVRLDLEIEAHLGSTLNARDILILEKGNRLDDARLEAIRQATGSIRRN
jgi:hypothetical protein